MVSQVKVRIGIYKSFGLAQARFGWIVLCSPSRLLREQIYDLRTEEVGEI